MVGPIRCPMSALTDLSDLLLHGLKDLYYAERQAKKVFGMMVDVAADSGLAGLLADRIERSDGDLARLEAVFDGLGHEAEGVTCEAMDGILAEARHLLKDSANEATRDAAIVFSAQAIDHYEITRYGSLAAYAARLGHDEAAARLGEALGGARAADEHMSRLAEGTLNARAT